MSATGFEGRLLEATGALLTLDPDQTAEAGLNLGEQPISAALMRLIAEDHCLLLWLCHGVGEALYGRSTGRVSSRDS